MGGSADEKPAAKLIQIGARLELRCQDFRIPTGRAEAPFTLRPLVAQTISTGSSIRIAFSFFFLDRFSSPNCESWQAPGTWSRFAHVPKHSVYILGRACLVLNAMKSLYHLLCSQQLQIEFGRF